MGEESWAGASGRGRRGGGLRVTANAGTKFPDLGAELPDKHCRHSFSRAGVADAILWYKMRTSYIDEEGERVCESESESLANVHRRSRTFKSKFH